jgi:predicted nuclease of restriction endonuclease-like RecB superfamily
MKLWIEPQSASGFREIFNAIKSFRLIHSIKGNAVNGYQITLTGPVSMFHRSQKYGVQMAVFLPALLNSKGWRMSAEIHSKEKGNAFYELDSQQKLLRSHYDTAPEYENPVIEKLMTNWEKLKSEWTLEQNREVVDLGQTAFIPDLVLRHPNGKKVYLDVLGFWTPDSLKKRLKEFESSGFQNFIIAAWEELRGSREDIVNIPENVIVFKRNLDAAMVELTAEKKINNPH